MTTIDACISGGVLTSNLNLNPSFKITLATNYRM